jgi:hypothetical protein
LAYEQLLAEEVARPGIALLILPGLLLLGSGVLTFLHLNIWALALLSTGMISGYWYLRRYQGYAARARYQAELERLRDDFRQRFDTELTCKEDIEALLRKMVDDHNKVRLLDSQLSQEEADLQNRRRQIAEELYALIDEKTEPETWDEILHSLENQAGELGAAIRQKEVLLIQLDVDAERYLEVDPGTAFDKQQMQEITERLNDIEKELGDEVQRLNSLKGLVCQETGDDFGIDWETVIRHLREKRAILMVELRDKTADVIGGIAVHQVLHKLKQREDEFVARALQSDLVSAPLFQMTRRYNRVELDGDNLLVSDAYNRFHVSQLSSGAREQVLLALRVGFAARLLQQDQLFLILDDAFQYSDWQRRELMVAKAADLARSGWQIIYFTMDDNIRKLFDDRGKKFGRDYRYFELKSHEKSSAQKQITLF